jgi:NAD(P)H-hydrate epimerase
MERAGNGLLHECMRLIRGVSAPRILVFCGKGNNGGDGLVLARLLYEHMVTVDCFCSASESEYSGDALINLQKLKKIALPCSVITTPEDLPKTPEDFSLVVDALLGTGYSGTPHGTIAFMIDWINRSGRPVLSVDAPSGSNMDTGEISPLCVQATSTVTMGLPKLGQLFYPAKSHAGHLIVHDLGFPPEVIGRETITYEIVEHSWARGHLPQRKPDGHKGDFGRVLVVAGSYGMSGAALLATEAALRTGAGMVTVAVPKCIGQVIASKFLETMILALPETCDGSIAKKACGTIMESMETWADVLVIGPGLGLNKETAELSRQMVVHCKKPAVVDADALNAFSCDSNRLCGIPYPRIFTPHLGELKRLWVPPSATIPLEKMSWLKEKTAIEIKNTVVLKGAPTVIATPSGTCYINSTGNSGMATAGSGDVLSGIIGGLLAQGVSAETAAPLGTYLHGLAGDFAAKESGEYALIAGDIIKNLPQALLQTQNTVFR